MDPIDHPAPEECPRANGTPGPRPARRERIVEAAFVIGATPQGRFPGASLLPR